MWCNIYDSNAGYTYILTCWLCACCQMLCFRITKICHFLLLVLIWLIKWWGAHRAPNVLVKTMAACTVHAPALTTCLMECQPRVGPPQQSPNDPIAGAATFFPVITIISSGEHGDDPMAIYVVLKEHVKSFFFLQKQWQVPPSYRLYFSRIDLKNQVSHDL